MSYTVQKLADISGVSVRTLHYYDEIGLLEPSYLERNGYRYYQEQELLKLQQILFFRELSFPLKEIKVILNNNEFDLEKGLKGHREQLKNEIDRLKGLLRTIDKTILKLKGEREMSDKEYFENLTMEEIDKHKEDARKEYGDYKDKTKNWTKDKFKKVFAEGEIIIKAIVEKMGKGSKPSDPSVQEDIAKHFKHINNFWDCSYEAYANLGKMYVEDERFTKNIDKAKDGLAKFMQEAMDFFSKNKTK